MEPRVTFSSSSFSHVLETHEDTTRGKHMNAFHLTGRLTRTPELKTSGGQTLTRLGLAVKNHRANDGVEYINVTVFGGLASACVKHLTKGQFVEIDGRMTSVWYTLEGGEELETTSLIGENVEFGAKPMND